MGDQFEFTDIIESVRAWEKYRDNWLSDLRKAKQPEPDKGQIENLREVWLEAFLIGRTTK
jgi:hypothetical protein